MSMRRADDEHRSEGRRYTIIALVMAALAFFAQRDARVNLLFTVMAALGFASLLVLVAVDKPWRRWR